MTLKFEFPAGLSIEEFITRLRDMMPVDLISRQHTLKTYYDSFDWRLYAQGYTLEFRKSKGGSALALRSLENEQLIANEQLKRAPTFSTNLPPGEMRNKLAPILEMRALLPLCTLVYESYHVNILNDDEKTIVRLQLDAYNLFKQRVSVQTVKGYEKTAKQLVEIFTRQLHLSPVYASVLLPALERQGSTPKEASGKLKLSLTADMGAESACKMIYSHLLNTIKANQAGARADIDSEFLHDFRVAIRKTRSGLGQLKNMLPDDQNAHFEGFFSWLGQITGSTRDLDVYLLNFTHYKDCLPASLKEDLNPLQEFLIAKQKKAHRELARHLRSSRYLDTLAEWERYLQEPELRGKVQMTIKQLADLTLKKSYQRVLKKGNAIAENSPGTHLHSLRKSMKKLRYLLEFFQSLYSAEHIKHQINHLKKLQEVLGDYQDYEAQEQHLKDFSEEMRALNTTPTSTFFAIGVLIQKLDEHKRTARAAFASHFAEFKHKKNQTAFKALLKALD